VLANKLTYATETIKKSFMRTATIKDYVEGIYVGEDGSEVIKSADLHGDPVSLIFVNNNSFAAGSDVWGTASKVAQKNLPQKEANELRAKQQCFSDQQIEVLTAASIMDFAKMKMGLSPMSRVYQGTGPFGIAFKQTEAKTYMQVDGEYFQLYRPREARVSFDGQVRVLMRNNQRGSFFGRTLGLSRNGSISTNRDSMGSESGMRFSDRKFPADAENHEYLNHNSNRNSEQSKHATDDQIEAAEKADQKDQGLRYLEKKGDDDSRVNRDSELHLGKISVELE
jgi:hypothetical protein